MVLHPIVQSRYLASSLDLVEAVLMIGDYNSFSQSVCPISILGLTCLPRSIVGTKFKCKKRAEDSKANSALFILKRSPIIP